MSCLTVSVIMCAYNGEQYIAQSILSVINQTYKNWELLVIDDGSEDRTREVVSEFQSKDDRIKYHYQRNEGQGNARNNGIRRSRGELIAFLDQDDLWLNNKLHLQIDALNQTNADLVFSDGYIFQTENDYNENVSFPLSYGMFNGGEMLDLLFIENRIPVLTVLVRKKLLEKVGLIDENLSIKNCDDYDLWLRLAENGASFFGMREKLARYRVHSDQASKNIARSLKSEIAVLEKHGDSVKIDKWEKRKRFRSLYRKLVAALVSENRVDEAREYLFRQLFKDGFGLITILQNMAIWIAPGKYYQISNMLYRIEASLNYRIVRPISNLRQSFMS